MRSEDTSKPPRFLAGPLGYTPELFQLIRQPGLRFSPRLDALAGLCEGFFLDRDLGLEPPALLVQGGQLGPQVTNLPDAAGDQQRDHARGGQAD